MSRHVVRMKLPVTSGPQLRPPESSKDISMEECSSLMQNLMQIPALLAQSYGL